MLRVRWMNKAMRYPMCDALRGDADGSADRFRSLVEFGDVLDLESPRTAELRWHCRQVALDCGLRCMVCADALSCVKTAHPFHGTQYFKAPLQNQAHNLAAKVAFDCPLSVERDHANHATRTRAVHLQPRAAHALTWVAHSQPCRRSTPRFSWGLASCRRRCAPWRFWSSSRRVGGCPRPTP